MAEDTIEEVGTQIMAATSGAGTALADGTTSKLSVTGIEDAVERTLKDLEAEWNDARAR